MDKRLKIGLGVLLGLIIFSSFKKPKKKVSIEIDDVMQSKSPDADFLVTIKKGATIHSATSLATKKMAQDVTWDGFNTNELPEKVKVRDGVGNYFHVYAPDFKLV